MWNRKALDPSKYVDGPLYQFIWEPLSCSKLVIDFFFSSLVFSMWKNEIILWWKWLQNCFVYTMKWACGVFLNSCNNLTVNAFFSRLVMHLIWALWHKGAPKSPSVFCSLKMTVQFLLQHKRHERGCWLRWSILSQLKRQSNVFCIFFFYLNDICCVCCVKIRPLPRKLGFF